MGLAMRVVFMVLALSGVLYFMYQLNTKGINKEVFHLEQGLSFDPATVKKFEWRSRDKISSLEKDPKGQWIPFERQTKITDILQQLASLKLTDLEQKNAGQIFVNLDVAGDVWIGQWDGLSFLWTQGPLKGKGSVLAEPLNKMFFRGRFVFDEDPKVELCKTGLEKVRVTISSKEHLVFKDGAGWAVSGQGKRRPMDTKFMEQWLAKACPTKVTATLDPAYSPSVDRIVNRMTFFYADKSQYDFFSLAKDLVMTEDRALILNGFKVLFDELKAEIEKTQS